MAIPEKHTAAAAKKGLQGLEAQSRRQVSVQPLREQRAVPFWGESQVTEQGERTLKQTALV